MWTWQSTSPSCPQLNCIVEVKNAKTLHSQKGIEKFHHNLLAAVQSGRANAGLFVSLIARYGGVPPLHLTVTHGVPVCYVSRSESDVLPAQCMVELGFRALASAWPLICRQRGEGVQLTVQAAAEQFEEQLKRCEGLSKHIKDIESMAEKLRRNAQALGKLRDSMVKGVEAVRLAHPTLALEIPELDISGLSSNSGESSCAPLAVKRLKKENVANGVEKKRKGMQGKIA